jgi:predicted GH43/DUF377 family glycosyl hydrolase
MPNPVLSKGGSGQWDGVDLLNPSVIKFNGKLFNYYSGYNGKVWRTGVATSKDGVIWDKYQGNPVLQPSAKDWDVSYISANGAAIVWKGKVLYFYQGRDKGGVTNIGLATSADGFQFTKMRTPVLSAGSAGRWDSAAVGDPYVVEKGGYLYLYYLGQDALAMQRLGVARSSDGVNWQTSSANPILDVGAFGTFDENGLGEPSVAFQPPYFYMLYTGRSNTERRNLGYAVSTDGIHWKKMSINGLLQPKQMSAWSSQVVCDSTLLSNGNGKWSVWFGGGNKPEPAQNLNGQVGMMTINLSQGRDPSSFDANAEWSKTKIHSTDVLNGSFPIEGEPGKRHAWIGPSAAIALVLGESQQNKDLSISGWVPAALISSKTKNKVPMRVDVLVNGKTVTSRTFAGDDLFALTAPWAAVENALHGSDIANVEIHSSKFMIPADTDGSPDRRALSMQIWTIKFQ